MGDAVESDKDEDGGAEDEEDDYGNPKTPSRSRKRKRGQSSLPKTPRKGRQAKIAQPTPHSKAALRQRKKLKKAVNASPRKRRAGGFAIRLPTLSQEAEKICRKGHKRSSADEAAFSDRTTYTLTRYCNFAQC